MLAALTFDFWDTIVRDDSDEPVRAARGLLPKAQAREALFVDEVLAHHPALGREAVADALAAANARFRHHWKVEHHTPTVAERLTDALSELGLGRTPGFDALVDGWERMEVDVPPALNPGAAEGLRALAPNYRLGIISDTIVSPGRSLRVLLGDYGLLDLFTTFVFSDEVGAAKPAPRVFALAAQGLGVPPARIAHVGDREPNDIVGAQAAGFKAILYTGAVDRGSDDTAADAVCRDYAALLSAVKEL
ncbi:MAG: HAD family hydrolase [Alphaproteobacteria bacterium]|nr:HAD family hydrolase [Alphaproteobacteria bacterium]